MDTNLERTLTRFEIPAILLISALLFGAAFANDQNLWRVATVALFPISGIALTFALIAASKFHPRWT